MVSLRRPRRYHNALANMTERELHADVRKFYDDTSQTLTGLRPYPTEREVQDAAATWQQKDNIENAIREAMGKGSSGSNDTINTVIPLNNVEKRALINEIDHSFSENGMWMVIFTVSLSAFLQGFVQSSQNGANLFADQWLEESGNPVNSQFAYANAAVYFSAAVIGCPLAAPMSSLFGRRGVIIAASFLIFAASVGSACITLNKNAWLVLGSIRLIGGVGMGLKATSTPILAAETAVGSWRGSSVLLWQLWVSFGIMMSFVVNICLNQIDDKKLKLRLILASPAVFALMLMYTVAKCPESFRYYLMPGSRKYSPEKAYASLLRLRNTKIQAVRDLYLTYKGIDNEFENEEYDSIKAIPKPQIPVVGAISHYVLQYWRILKVRRLRNAAITTGIVALSQQLSGINLMAFYGGTTLVGIGPGDQPSDHQISKAMLYNLIFDVLGRRKVLLFTIPVSDKARNEVVAFWIYFHTAFYSPGMGPVPFVLAAESFPLAFRDTGASLAISINLLFAGLLAWLQPLLVAGIKFGGTLGVFAGLNVVAFVLIFLLMEETSGVPLESLGSVFKEPKTELISFQLFEFLPWFGQFILGRSSLAERPERTVDLSSSSAPAASVTSNDEEQTWNSDGVANECNELSLNTLPHFLLPTSRQMKQTMMNPSRYVTPVFLTLSIHNLHKQNLIWSLVADPVPLVLWISPGQQHI
ncbi:myo-inositol transport ITR1 [Fusarium napiforme]|uniref:Myo-inositol transport ITR1 n=1 Tax=Fusarium napiforme TaxID=42672 RepID=A0A8H5JTS4_9HYPO|nr:myo-inositol transport ITR1 [Fusarium napiforme]